MPAADIIPHQFSIQRNRERFCDSLKISNILYHTCDRTNQRIEEEAAVRYAPIDVADMWDQLPSYADATKTYEEWREEENDRDWAFLRSGSGDYYREFFKITEFLRSRQRLSTSEIARTFYKPFTPTLWQSVHSRLQLKYPDHNPDDFWPLRHILDAAHYVLHGTRVDAPAQGTPAAATTSTALPPGTIKTEDFTSLIETVTRTIAQAFATSANMAFANGNHRLASLQYCEANPNTTSEVVTTAENWARNRRVSESQEDIDIGRIRRNIENKVVLPSGAFVPRNVTGATMRDRILEWHRTHPNNLARGQLSSNTNPPAGQMIFEITSNPNVASSYQLTREDRITALEREIFALRKGKETFDGVEIPRHLPADLQYAPVNRVDNPPTHEPTEASQVTNPPSVSAPAPAASSTPSPATVPAPIHPYSQARDAT
ncbi:hypothetical protein A0H81_05912 [Grifola frondosa]|uniref:Uncharacterized protein n=1 Tax=Grifola frondosa TaxID=5627 RepID=A0A1C7MBC2_GRIFR|nr:hypothetical protein A0H81_05912 [Grifola frondosa]